MEKYKYEKYKYEKYKTKYLNLFYDYDQVGDAKKYVVKLDTYEEWLIYANANSGKDCEWIYHIIDHGVSISKNKVLINESDFVLVTEYTMKEDDLNSFHLLALPKDKTIRGMRDLKSEHIPLLQKMVIMSKNYITSNYAINENEIEAHFHYPPGVLLLHIHFELTNNTKIRRPLREHSVNEVIENLKIDANYYTKINMEILEILETREILET